MQILDWRRGIRSYPALFYVTRFFLFILVTLVLAACGETPVDKRLADVGPPQLAALSLSADRPTADDTLHAPRTAFMSDKGGGFWFGPLTSPGERSSAAPLPEAAAFSVGGRRLIDGWRWFMDADSALLGPREIVAGTARPDFIVRRYEARDSSGLMSRLLSRLRGETTARLTERLTLLDDAGALLIEVPHAIGTVAFAPLAREVRGVPERRGETLLVQVPVAGGDTAHTWLAVHAEGGEVATLETEEAPLGGRGATRRTLGEVAFPTPGRLVLATGASAGAAQAAAERMVRHGESLRERRSRRMVDLLAAAPFVTGDEAFNQGFQWALLSLDALVVEDTARARLALGVPGAEASVGPGTSGAIQAFVQSGQWRLAQKLLLTLADGQRFDRRTDLLGRAPDVAPPGEAPRYLTTEATPRYLAAAGDVVRATGNRSLVTGPADFWFKTVFALRGLYQPDSRFGTPVDSAGLLRAWEGYGTWADGTSPRRGAPVEAQGALWQALRTATDFARIMGVARRSSALWYADSARALERRFVGNFVTDDSLVIDLLGEAGDETARPSALIALNDLTGLTPERRARFARVLLEQVGLPYGVASRSPSDSLFHPYLEVPGVYNLEDARFEGSVWTWVAAPVVELVASTGGSAVAYAMTEAQRELMLERAAAGAIPELLAGHPRVQGAAPEVGGAPIQPWSLAGFVEAAYSAYLGAQYAGPNDLVIAPRLPEAWGEVTTALRMGAGWVHLTLSQAEGLSATVRPKGGLPEGARLRVQASGRELTVPLVNGDATVDSVIIDMDADGVLVNGAAVETTAPEMPPIHVWDGFVWPEPEVRDTYPVLRSVEARRVLTTAQMRRENLAAQVILTQTDPEGDDWGGTGTFTYPPGYPDGILDATYLELARDDSTTYVRVEFAALANRRAFGFPPTFIALAIDTDDGGRRVVGRNAQYDVPRSQAFEYVVYVGDGLVVEDAAGRSLGGLPPGRDLFDVEAGAVTFALPEVILPPLQRGSRVALLVGARAPGGRVGQFRDVGRVATDVLGGGRVDADSPTAYDVITATISR